MAYIVLPQQQREKTGQELFAEGFSPGLQKAIDIYLQKQIQDMQTKRAYQQAQQMGMVSPYQQVPIQGSSDRPSPDMYTTQGGSAQIAPMRGVQSPTQYRLNQGTSVSFKDGIPQFAREAQDPVAQQYKQSQLALNQAYINALQGGSGLAQSEPESLIPPGENPEDYIMKPIVRNVRGIPQRTNVPTKKPLPPDRASKGLQTMDSNISDLQSNLRFLEEKPKIKDFIGPGLVQRPGALADVLAQVGMAPKDFPTFKAKTDMAFQKYRKEVTGVQAGFPELQWLVVDFPKPTDTAEVYISKAQNAIRDMQRNRKLLVDHLAKIGYAVSNLKNEPTQTEQQLPPGFSPEEWEVVQ